MPTLPRVWVPQLPNISMLTCRSLPLLHLHRLSSEFVSIRPEISFSMSVISSITPDSTCKCYFPPYTRSFAWIKLSEVIPVQWLRSAEPKWLNDSSVLQLAQPLRKPIPQASALCSLSLLTSRLTNRLVRWKNQTSLICSVSVDGPSASRPHKELTVGIHSY